MEKTEFLSDYTAGKVRREAFEVLQDFGLALRVRDDRPVLREAMGGFGLTREEQKIDEIVRQNVLRERNNLEQQENLCLYVASQANFH